jgi:hypothetical protein
MTRQWVRGAVGVLLLSGCYRYVPVAAAPAPGAEVRLYLTPDGASRLAPALGPQTAIVAGRVEASRDEGVSLVMSSTTKAYGATTRWIGERVTIPAAAIARGERRVLDRRRSLLAGAGVALATAAGYAVLRAVRGGGADAGGGGPTPTP